MDRATRRQALQFTAAASTGFLLAASTHAAEAPTDKNASVTFDEIDRKVKAIDLRAFEKGGQREITSDRAQNAPAGVLGDVCSLYKGIRDIIVAVGNFPLLPTSWRDAVKLFVRAMDAICA